MFRIVGGPELHIFITRRGVESFYIHHPSSVSPGTGAQIFMRNMRPQLEGTPGDP
jgi:hypothetical protein